eukprot:gene9155-7782_t
MAEAEHPWLYPRATREALLLMIEGQPMGVFGIRCSGTQPGCFVLCVSSLKRRFSDAGVVREYLIVKDGGTYYLEYAYSMFSSLHQLVLFYSTPQGIPELGLMLRLDLHPQGTFLRTTGHRRHTQYADPLLTSSLGVHSRSAFNFRSPSRSSHDIGRTGGNGHGPNLFARNTVKPDPSLDQEPSRVSYASIAPTRFLQTTTDAPANESQRKTAFSPQQSSMDLRDGVNEKQLPVLIESEGEAPPVQGVIHSLSLRGHRAIPHWVDRKSHGNLIPQQSDDVEVETVTTRHYIFQLEPIQARNI